jgi:hypothetical protein
LLCHHVRLADFINESLTLEVMLETDGE